MFDICTVHPHSIVIVWVVPPLNLTPPRLTTSNLPALAPWGICACGAGQKVYVWERSFSCMQSSGACLLEPPHPAPFTEHAMTLEVQLGRCGAFLQTAASCVGSHGRPYITLCWFWPRWDLPCEYADSDYQSVCYLYSIFSYHFL